MKLIFIDGQEYTVEFRWVDGVEFFFMFKDGKPVVVAEAIEPR